MSIVAGLKLDSATAGTAVNKEEAMARLKVRHIGDVAVITPHGYLMGGEETEELQRVIEEQLKAGNRKLLIDLIETVHLNSNALGAVTQAHSRYQAAGGQVRLCHLTDRIENALVITRLSLVLEVDENERESIANFQAAPTL